MIQKIINFIKQLIELFNKKNTPNYTRVYEVFYDGESLGYTKDGVILNIINSLKSIYAEFGADWKTINIMGVRNDRNPGTWNDFIIVNIGDRIWKCVATVDPSKYYTDNPLNKDGAAHLCLGYHKDIWIHGKHQGKYNALVQRGTKVKIWRDTNKNFINDDNKYEYKTSGINFHHGYSTTGLIKKHSAGCQVIRNKEEFQNIIKEIKKTNLTKFRYLLIPIQNCPKDIIALNYGEHNAEVV